MVKGVFVYKISGVPDDAGHGSFEDKKNGFPIGKEVPVENGYLCISLHEGEWKISWRNDDGDSETIKYTHLFIPKVKVIDSVDGDEKAVNRKPSKIGNYKELLGGVDEEVVHALDMIEQGRFTSEEMEEESMQRIGEYYHGKKTSHFFA